MKFNDIHRECTTEQLVRLLLGTNINITIKVGGFFPELHIGCNFASILVGIVFYLHKTFLHYYPMWNIFTSGRICQPFFHKATPAFSFWFTASKFINHHLFSSPVFSDWRKFALVSYFIPIWRHYIVVDYQSNFNNLHT